MAVPTVDRELALGNVQRDVLKVVLAGATNLDRCVDGRLLDRRGVAQARGRRRTYSVRGADPAAKPAARSCRARSSSCWRAKAAATANAAMVTATISRPATAAGQILRRTRQDRVEPCRKAPHNCRRRSMAVSRRDRSASTPGVKGGHGSDSGLDVVLLDRGLLNRRGPAADASAARRSHWTPGSRRSAGRRLREPRCARARSRQPSG